MRPTTDPSAWLAQADPCSAREAWDLFAAAATLRSVGVYRCQPSADGRTVKLTVRHVPQALVLYGLTGRQRLVDALMAWCEAELPQVTLPEITVQPMASTTASRRPGMDSIQPVQTAGQRTGFRFPAA
ncbi:hypothetical protein F7Q92_09835 [Ideonella dechloratans]|uniref:Uncharacterized protein n=1 Tax=Ideonella dechloratans TaxID=36863 RepID=A0A643FCK0_IDEDE|nr:hypothetical protein [Ideonella dechloratans]KAB0583023.1 hypothetical protein F7Q92_09835 [Ideonella dechloratans]UFU09578.1 hypothetical protein LRM40_14905 [Ideonella dechloratans]